MKNRYPSFLFSAVASALVAAAACGANLMPNASFELGLAPHGVIVTLPFAANPVQPEVTADDSAAVHGKRSLRIDNTRTGGEAMLVMRDVETGSPKERFAVSAYLKADRPTKVSLGVWRTQLGDDRYSVLTRAQTFEIGTEWQRVELRRVKVNAPVTGFAVRLSVPFDAVVWVDAVQVEASEGAATAFAPAAPVEAAWELDDRVFPHGDDEPVEIAATLRACAYAGGRREVAFATPAGDFPLPVVPGEIATRRVTVRESRSGIHRLGGTFAADGTRGTVAEEQFTVVPQVDPRPGKGFRIGANGILGIARVKNPPADCSRFRNGEKVWRGPLGYAPDDFYRDLRRGGYSIARMHDGGYSWEDIEPEKGAFDWSKMDVIEAGLRRNGLEPMFVFGSHGVFCTKHTGEGAETNWFARVNSRPGKLKGKLKGRDGKRIFYHPADRDWTDWITAAVSRYHKTVKLWEIVNEPNGTVESAAVYAHYAELCYKAVKAVDRDSTVIGICSTGDLGLNAAKFFSFAGEAGAFKWLDAASFHPYAQALDVPGKDGETALANLRRICDCYRPGVPIWNTEIYYINAYTPAQVAEWKKGLKPKPEDRQLKRFPAGNLIKRYAIDLGGGCAASVPLASDQHLGTGAGRDNQVAPTFVATSFAVNRRYVASAAFARYLEGATFLRKPMLDPGFNGFVYRDRHGGEVALVWRRPGEADATVRRPADAVVRDLCGNRVDGDEIAVTAEPVYFFGKDLFARRVAREGAFWTRLDVTRDIVPGSALDFSGRLDAPAGKYGWLKAVGDHFEFEKRPGVPQRFYGVNLCMSLNVPDTHADADRLVARLAAMGYNSLRIHHHDAWCTGFRPGGELDAKAMDAFDYLYAKAIEKGLYLTTDLFVSRKVSWKEIGEDREGLVDMHAYKALTLFHDGAFGNWKRFAENFLRHVNPYTGRAYIDEPALPLLCTVNEGWLLCGWFKVREMPLVKAAYADWRNAKVAQFGPDFMAHSCATNVTEANCYGWKNAATALFLAEFQAKGHARQVEFLKSLGVKALLTAGNHGPNNAPNGRLRAEAFDYVDVHCYVDHPTHLNKTHRWGLPSCCANENPILGFDRLHMNDVCWARTAGKPFAVTEWNFSGPGECRGICGLYGGALMGRQDWSGVWRFAYGHDKCAVADVPAANEMPGYFNVAGDPINAATERLVANLFLRRDVTPLKDRVNLVIDAKALMPEGGAKGDWETYALAPVRMDPVWKARCSNALGEVDGATNRSLSDWGRKFGASENPIVSGVAKDGVVTIDRNLGMFALATPCTCGVFAPAGEYAAGALACRIVGPGATLSVTSLDGKPIKASARLLVSHLTDCCGDGAATHWDEKGRYVSDSFGSGKYLVRNGRADVSVQVEKPEGWKAYALAPSGRRRFELPVRAVGGKLAFAVDVRGADGTAVMEYELARTCE